MLEQPIISIGYVVVRPRYEGDELLVSASPETCPRYPPDDLLPWVSGEEADPQVARNEPWRLDPELQSWASKNFGSVFGWQAVFYRVDPAIEFRNRFLGEVDDPWVLGIGLPSRFCRGSWKCSNPERSHQGSPPSVLPGTTKRLGSASHSRMAAVSWASSRYGSSTPCWTSRPVRCGYDGQATRLNRMFGGTSRRSALG